MSLADLIANVQKGDDNSLLILISKFHGLLKKYANKLKSEDAYYDLQIVLIEIIKKNLIQLKKKEDPYIINYIEKSIKNAYIYYSKKERKIDKNEYLFSDFETDESSDKISNIPSTPDQYSNLLIQDIKSIVSDKEFNVIYLNFFYNLTISEIAKQENISRQAVNKKKISGLKKLKNAILI